MHESVGHPTGSTASTATRPVRRHELPQARRPRLAALRLGQMNVTDDARPRAGSERSHSTTRASGGREPVVVEGVLPGLLTSRETRRDSGRARAARSRGGLEPDAAVRMTNLHLEPARERSRSCSPTSTRRLPRDEQQLVDRRERLTSSSKAGAWEIRRVAAGDAARRDVHGRHPISGARSTRRGTRGVAYARVDELRKGTAGQHAHVSHGASPRASATCRSASSRERRRARDRGARPGGGRRGDAEASSQRALGVARSRTRKCTSRRWSRTRRQLRVLRDGRRDREDEPYDDDGLGAGAPPPRRWRARRLTSAPGLRRRPLSERRGLRRGGSPSSGGAGAVSPVTRSAAAASALRLPHRGVSRSRSRRRPAPRASAVHGHDRARSSQRTRASRAGRATSSADTSTPPPSRTRRWTRRNGHAARVDQPGPYRVVLEPYAIAELLMYVGFDSFGALGLLEERSILHGSDRRAGSRPEGVDRRRRTRSAWATEGLRLRRHSEGARAASRREWRAASSGTA